MTKTTQLLRKLLPASMLSLSGCILFLIFLPASVLQTLMQVGCEQCFGSSPGTLLVANGTEGRETRPSESPGLPPGEEIDQAPDEPGFVGDLDLACDALLTLLAFDFESGPGASQSIGQIRSGGIAVSSAQAPAERLPGVPPEGLPPTLYMTNSIDDTVLAIDPATRRLLGSVRVGERPRGVAVSLDGYRIFVANEDSGSLSVVETNGMRVLTTIPLPGQSKPYGVAITPDGAEVWVASHEAPGFVHVIDSGLLAVTATIRVGRLPAQIAISPDGTLAYVTNQEDNRLSVVDVWTRTVQRSLNVPSPYAAAFDPTGSRVYVSSHSNPGTVRMFDVASDAVLATWEVGLKPEHLQLDPFATRLFVTNRLSPFVSAINLLSGEVESEIPAPRGLGPLAFAPN